MLTDETFRRVRLAAQMRFGKATSNNFPLELMSITEVTFETCVLNSFNRLLLSMFRVAAVSMLIPSRVLKKVFEIVMYLALEMTAGSVRLERAGREIHEMLLTDERSVKEKVDKTVKLNRSRDLPTEPKVVLPRLVKPPASWQIRLPVICSGPSSCRTPDAAGPIRTSPSMVEQEAYWVASA